MNILPIKAYEAQNFTAKKTDKKRIMGRHDSGYIYPNTDTKTIRGSRKAKPEPVYTTTIIHWMDYGDGHPVPVSVEVEE